ncbi:cell wall metabolism sensor histidine kinase WalK [Paenibacillus sp. R14(2021)]|uniref:sensor histidine kinase n=1 Tax=Paenibacillus sp. R14(2021) TaxID=2859228 RepID=UPI001C611E6F|nr:HAMP domain-containing sensor histidine kinase [Paenibacillus sp. R14(2021)]
MKMMHQLNLAFGVLIVLVITVTAVMNHYVLMEHFIGTQKDGMQSLGASLSDKLQVVPGAGIGFGPSPEAVPLTITESVLPNVEAVITNTEGKVVSSLVPSLTTAGSAFFTQPAAPASVSQLTTMQAIADGKDSRFVVSAMAIPQGTLTLYTPLSKIKAVEQALLGRLLLVLCVSGAVVYLLSLLLTRRLIHPLAKLRAELKKVESRRFSEVRLVQAGGEIGAVAQTVYELAGELERYNQAQKQFFQNASHELKTPLMSISGYAEGIRDGVFEGESASKGLAIIMSESARLTNIVTEMTLLAKLDSEEDVFRMKEVDVRELLTETKERLNPQLARSGVSLEIDFGAGIPERLIIRADRDKLAQALLNVASNAIRYARKQIVITVQVRRERLSIAVQDDGAGFPQELLPHLFHRFVKGKDGETGLGLAISRAIVERCKGEIGAGNRQGGGAVISIGFPLAA